MSRQAATRRLWRTLPAACLVWLAPLAHANDFPTVERVRYVQECMRAHPGAQFEMTSKCACVLDALAQELGYDDYVTLSTIAKASTMAGERGAEIRDAPSLAPQLKRYRALQAQAEKSCFIGSGPR